MLLNLIKEINILRRQNSNAAKLSTYNGSKLYLNFMRIYKVEIVEMCVCGVRFVLPFDRLSSKLVCQLAQPVGYCLGLNIPVFLQGFVKSVLFFFFCSFIYIYILGATSSPLIIKPITMMPVYKALDLLGLGPWDIVHDCVY